MMYIIYNLCLGEGNVGRDGRGAGDRLSLQACSPDAGQQGGSILSRTITGPSLKLYHHRLLPYSISTLHCKTRLAIFLSPAGM
jgi:hypothetical protein